MGSLIEELLRLVRSKMSPAEGIVTGSRPTGMRHHNGPALIRPPLRASAASHQP